MAEKAFKVSIYTQEAAIFEGEAFSLQAPGTLGSFGVLANHAPFISTLVPGKITIRSTSAKPTIINSIAAGFAEVSHNEVTLLLDSIG
jgi:F-type H+-transporting ATPase subunit epsilon